MPANVPKLEVRITTVSSVLVFPRLSRSNYLWIKYMNIVSQYMLKITVEQKYSSKQHTEPLTIEHYVFYKRVVLHL